FDRINISGTAKLVNLVVDDSQDSFLLHSKNLDLKLARETAPVRKNEVVLQMDETSFHYKKQIDFEAVSFDTKATLAPDKSKRYVLALHSELNALEARSKPDSAEILVRGLKLKGNFFMKDLIHFYRDQKLSDRNTVSLLADSIHLDYKDDITLNAGFVNIQGSGNKARDSGLAVRLNAQLRALKASSKKDSLNVIATNADFKIRLAGNKTNKTLFANTDFVIDSAGVRIARNFLGLSKGNFHVKLQKRKGQTWKPEGSFDFKRMIVRTSKLKAPIRMPATKLSFVNDDFMLDHAHIKYLETDVIFSGKLEHARGLFNGQKVQGNLLVESEFINANQLMNAFSGFEDEAAVVKDSAGGGKTPATQQVAETTNSNSPGANAKHGFKIPDSLAFDFTTNIKRLHFGGSDLDNVRGKMTVKNGKVVLEHLKMKTLAADLDATLDYIPSTDGKSVIDFTFYLSQIELNKLRQFLPILDTLMPMANSFVGKAEFRIKGKTVLDDNLEIDMKSFKGIAALKAAHIMVLDGPTFRDLAKTLMFKNKEVNPIEKLTVEMEFDNNDVNILPSLVEIDRYKLAVGGVQHLDLSYAYHISVLKSPVPFKTGVDLAGKNTDFKINVTKAKYKYYFTDKERLLKKADPAISAKRVAILKSLGFEDEKVEVEDEVDE
ncbi:MAG: AsmA-like C-terminal region-containing protein, partial [Flavitalea sp.]